MHRLFVAIRPPEAVIDTLFDTMEGLDGARWQSDLQLHLTLRFIGEVERPQAEDIALALSRLSFTPFAVKVEGVGSFDTKGRSNSIWAGIAPSRELSDLQARVEQACRRAGAAPETRKFLPHITLARINAASGDIAPWLLRHSDLRLPPFTVRHFLLCESHLSEHGASYEDIARFPA